MSRLLISFEHGSFYQKTCQKNVALSGNIARPFPLVTISLATIMLAFDTYGTSANFN